LKVKEVPGYVTKFAGENWTADQTKSRLANWLERYRVQVRVKGGFQWGPWEKRYAMRLPADPAAPRV
jgi:hypothetical protein